MWEVGDIREFQLYIARFVDAHPSLRGPLHPILQHDKKTTPMGELLQCVAHWVRLTEVEGAPPFRRRREKVAGGFGPNRRDVEAFRQKKEELRYL